MPLTRYAGITPAAIRTAPTNIYDVYCSCAMLFAVGIAAVLILTSFRR